MDFTINIYKQLLRVLKSQGYTFQKITEFYRQPAQKMILLRHDIDARRLHALEFAQIQHEFGIKGTYYFRMIPKIYDKDLIRKIASLGHEIGFHYETMDKANGDIELAYEIFCKELAKLRNIVDVTSICMHGSPLSRYDNRTIWEEYDYRNSGIKFEPYFDLDFSHILYLTDTGRRWNGDKVSIRDHPATGNFNRYMEGKKQSLSNLYSFRSTLDIIDTCNNGNLPEMIMFNFHPHRWTNDPMVWTHELIMQNLKNVIKAGLKKVRNAPVVEG